MSIVKRPARRRPIASVHRRRPVLAQRRPEVAPADDDRGTSSSSDDDAASPSQYSTPVPLGAPIDARYDQRLARICALGDAIDGRYQRLSKIGGGSFGDVYRAKDSRTGEIVAVKCLRREDDDPDGHQLDRVLAGEVRALEACRGHPHIVRILDHGRHRDVKTGPEAYIVMEFVGLTLEASIRRHGDDARPRRYAEGDVRHLMRQLLTGVRRMHELGLMHRDIKPDNVLVDGRGTLKLCDLGFARTKEEAPPPFSNPVAALLYRAPEVMLGSTTYDEMIDTWALGCIMAQLLAGERLFYARSEEEMLVRIADVLGMDDITGWSGYENCMIPKALQSGRRRRRSRLRQLFAFPGTAGGSGLPELSPAGFQVLRGLLRCNPEKRMTAAQALQHRWFVGGRVAGCCGVDR
ncbi:hypothetical protein E2562_005654 [Oryza meyeriana var. granulata]|uniref:[RNA-polymerase]-subunit kinase n=1 Tax=Oryza meyeriana var. granulata TaxID=110450 RepID=A0A6G1BJR3_9ORYZ|nr:hypothetical protein E2562_005654 [Oryza meyeriana var. granulata]